MKPYSLDVRERVLTALDGGMARSAAVCIFQVSLGRINRWLATRQATETIAPKQARGGHVRPITSAHDDAIRAHVTARPDATRADHATQWNALHGPSISQWTIGRAIRRLGRVRKKALMASERDPWDRARLWVEQEDVDPTDVVVIDELGSNLDMTPRYARAPRGD